MLIITDTIHIPDEEIEFQFVRSQGAGGQHVNKTATAAQLRFDFLTSPSLPDGVKELLLSRRDRRISVSGIIVIKAQRYRSQDMNRVDALTRLAELIRAVTVQPKKRRPTRPTGSSKEKRLAGKTRDAKVKKLREKVNDGE